MPHSSTVTAPAVCLTAAADSHHSGVAHSSTVAILIRPAPRTFSTQPKLTIPAPRSFFHASGTGSPTSRFFCHFTETGSLYASHIFYADETYYM